MIAAPVSMPKQSAPAGRTPAVIPLPPAGGSPGRRSGKVFLLFLLLALLLGAFLRVYQLGGQILGGDEWHAIHIAASFPMGYILTHWHVSDNCIPLTAFYKLLLNAGRLDETGLRSIHLISGIAAILVFPLLVKPLFGARTAIIFGFLVAVSPFLVYYSRFARPYGIVALASFVSIWSFYSWMTGRRALHASLYVLGAVISSYFNPVSSVAVLSPLLFAVFARAFPAPPRATAGGKPFPSFKDLSVVGIFLLAGLALCFIPAMNSLGSVTQKVATGKLFFNTFAGFLRIFSGSGNPFVVLLFIAAFIYGLAAAFRRHGLLVRYAVAVMTITIAANTLIRPLDVNVPAIFARYAMPCLPLWLLFIAFALDDISTRFDLFIARKIPALYPPANPLLGALIIGIIASGPLPDVYRAPNNFTNHNEFQFEYRKNRLSDLSGPVLGKFPHFYLGLKNEATVAAIIEYPYLFRFWLHNYHLYQRYHGKRVLIGHNPASFLAHGAPVMHENIRLDNFVDIDDPGAIIRSQAAYLVIHKNLLDEALHASTGRNDTERGVMAELRRNLEEYARECGQPAQRQAERAISAMKRLGKEPHFEDEWITVFKIGDRQ